MTVEIISRGHPRAYARGVMWYGVKSRQLPAISFQPEERGSVMKATALKSSNTLLVLEHYPDPTLSRGEAGARVFSRGLGSRTHDGLLGKPAACRGVS